MPDIINPETVAQVILLAREAEDMTAAQPRAELKQFIAGLTEDDAVALVALAWLGRESFTAGEWDDALQTARDEATTPTEDYLSDMPQLAGYLEDGLEAMGISAGDAEEGVMRR